MLAAYIDRLGENLGPSILLGRVGISLSRLSQKICSDGVLWLG